MIAAVPILAVGLHVALTEWGTQRLHCDGAREIIAGASGTPLFIFWQSIADVVSFGPGPAPSCGFSVTEGLFARAAIPPLAGLLGGILVPGLLMAAFFAAALRRRWAQIVSLVLAALFWFGALVNFDAQWVEYRVSGSHQYLYGPYTRTPVDPPIISTGTSRPNCENCSEFLLWGFYPRQYVPRALAVSGGMVVPLFFLMTALAVGLQPVFRRKNRA
jgi:hypothetical protein